MQDLKFPTTTTTKGKFHASKKAQFEEMKTLCIGCGSTFNRITVASDIRAVCPDWAIYWTLGNFSKPLATIYFFKSPTFLGIFVKMFKSIDFSSEIIFRQLLYTFGDFFLVTLLWSGLI